MDNGQQELLARLSVGPSFLLLGQAFGELETGEDETLLEAAQAAGAHWPRGSVAVLQDVGPDVRLRVFERLETASRSAPVPVWMSEVARFPWNGVFTSAIDARVLRAFEADWRRVVPASGPARGVHHPRSATELKVRMLFGGVTLAAEERPPLDALDLATKRRDAREVLGELAGGLLTPRGVLAIEAYRTWDWLEPADLFGLISQFAPGQVHLFSADGEVLADDFVKGAVERGVLTAHSKSLSAILNEAEYSGRLVRPAAVTDLTTRVLRIGERRAEIPRDVWNTVIGTARPIDDSLLQPFPPASPSIQYQRFRSFLGASEGAPPWQAIASGYQFEREFEHALWTEVMASARAPNIPGPFVLSGQTASGKSTAMQALAVKAARTADWAVIHVSRRAERPQFKAIDGFALWAEEQGSTTTLLLWDGMTDSDEYFELHRRLRARGRRVLIVGTTYVTPRARSRTVMAPAELSEIESERIQAWLASFDVAVRDEDILHLARDASFLAALYRLLPDARPGLERGLRLELRAAEAGMERLGRLRPAEDGRLNVMAEALRRAGVQLPTFVSRGSDGPATGELPLHERDTAEQMTALVLVAGRRGLRIPLELVLRILGRAGSNTVVEVIKQFDIVRWSEDESGEQYLGTRTSLEAELLARSDLRDAEAEVAVLCTMLRDLRPLHGLGGGGEVQFAVDLLSRVGPETDEGQRFIAYYPQIIQALEDLRSNPARAHHRLMLVEGHFRREYVRWGSNRSILPPERRLDLLAGAEQVLSEAIDITPPGARSRQTLLVELASVLGAQAYERSRDGMDEGYRLEHLTERIMETVMAARAIDPENYYPVDVVAWVSIRLAKQGSLTATKHASLIADVLASFEGIDDQQLSPNQLAKYDHRRAQLAELLDDPAVRQEHIQRLEQNQDPTAYFLIALRRSGLMTDGLDEAGGREALNYLLSAPEDVRSDWRCSQLMLDLFWLTRTGQRFLRGEREVLPFSDRDWEECLSLVDAMLGTSPFDTYRVEFLRGLAAFHLGQHRLSLSIFEELDRETTNLSRRIIATYLASTAEGVPAKFTGSVRFVSPDGRRGKVWVDQLGIELPFIPYRFSPELMERGDALPGFHIAFNMRGPYADPIRTAQPVRASRPRA